jgi:hypothetical protein
LFGGTAAIVLLAIFSPKYFAWVLLVLNIHVALWMLRVTGFGLLGALSVRCWSRRDWATELREISLEKKQRIEHCVIIPNYKEDLVVLQQTLASLAESLSPMDMTVVVGVEMREGEEVVRAKAKTLFEMFGGQFREMLATYHPDGIPGEVAGKSSNTQWCFRETKRIFEQSGRFVDGTNMLITVSDADTLWHPDYFAALSVKALETSPEKRIWTLWQPPVWLLRNFFTVPALTKVTAFTTCVNELGGLFNPFGQHIIFSSYSISWELASITGGWDTDVIAEDHHMFCKCYFQSIGKDGSTSEKAKGQIQAPQLTLQPIWLPRVKGFMVESSGGYLASLHARWVQALRHMQGVGEFSYLLLKYITLVRAAGGPWNVGWRTQFGIARAGWSMLCCHLFPYLQFISLAVTFLMQHFVQVDQCYRSPISNDWGHQTSCVVFLRNPVIFAIPLALNIGATYETVCQYLQLNRSCPITSVSAAHRRNGRGEKVTWEMDAGGSPKYAWMRNRVVVLVQIILETMILSAPTVIGFGIMPSFCAVIMIIRKGTKVDYVVAEKPTKQNGATTLQIDAKEGKPKPSTMDSLRIAVAI